jgi:hypothetical protein
VNTAPRGGRRTEPTDAVPLVRFRAQAMQVPFRGRGATAPFWPWKTCGPRGRLKPQTPERAEAATPTRRVKSSLRAKRGEFSARLAIAQQNARGVCL